MTVGCSLALSSCCIYSSLTRHSCVMIDCACSCLPSILIRHPQLFALALHPQKASVWPMGNASLDVFPLIRSGYDLHILSFMTYNCCTYIAHISCTTLLAASVYVFSLCIPALAPLCVACHCVMLTVCALAVPLAAFLWPGQGQWCFFL